MANAAHVDVLRLGGDAIAEWLKDQTPDASGLDLSDATLDGIDYVGWT